MNKTAPGRICLGRVTGVHGLKGEVKAVAAVDDLETLAAVGAVDIGADSYDLVAARFQKHSLLLSLAGVQTREQAERLVGRDIWLDPLRLPPLPPGEYYWFEILGLAVFRADTNAYVGKIQAIMPTPAHDVYVVQEQDVEYLVPAVAAVILSIDPAQGRMLIAPEGLTAQDRAD